MSLRPICHRTIHAIFSNVERARRPVTPESLRDNPAMARFLKWIANPPIFMRRH